MQTATATRKRELSEQPVDDDRRLVEQIAAGEVEAVDRLYQRFSRPLFAYLLRLTDNRQLAEEILQETFVAAWRAASSFSGRSSVKTWMFGIARRQSFNVLRRKSLPLVDKSALDEVPEREPGPESIALAQSDREEVITAIGMLSRLHREVLTLTFFHELSYEEVAEVLEVPIGTVKSRLSNAKRALRLALRSREEAR